MRLYYREIDPLPKAGASEDKKTADKADLATTETAESNDNSSSDGQKMVEDSQTMEEKEETSSEAKEQEGEGEVDAKEKINDIPNQDPKEETNEEERSSEKMEGCRTEEENNSDT